MNPDKSSPGGDLPAHKPTDNSSPNDNSQTQASSANVIRSQIDALYGNPTRPHTVATPEVAQDTNPYHRTHNAHPKPEAEQWREYHTAWQNYYQKYYESYYTHQLSTKRAKTEPAGSNHYFAGQPVTEEQKAEELSNDEALLELRQKLLGRVSESARKVRRSRHFIPIVAALTVVLIFIFIQFNQFFVANVQAYVSPGSIDPQNIVVDPTNDVQVSSEPRLIIPKINVDVPVAYDVGSDYNSQMAAMNNGLAHFSIPGASSHPGEIGNTAIAGHSSNDLFDSGDYKFIFAQLDKLAPGDSIYANYHSKRYTYVVTKIETVKPNEISKLIYPTDKPVLTLITCTPLGTALNRLLVTAEQVSPDPSTAAAAPVTDENAPAQTTIPGTQPTLLEKLFGANG
ncbi:MAG: sortase family protein [Candidatus Saccharibacteria bacterium]|nr:sortase family protein [Candidatus Saccharibacteria bacterium]